MPLPAISPPFRSFEWLATLKGMEHITADIKGIKAAIEKAKSNSNIVPTVSGVLQDGTLIEMVYRREERRTLLCIAKEGQVRYETNLMEDGKRLVPYSPENNLLKNDVVLFPSEAAHYESEQALVAEIRAVHPPLRGCLAALRGDHELLRALHLGVRRL